MNIGLDYYRGCLVGGAIGDALGEPVEFHSLAQIRQLCGALGVTGFPSGNGYKGEFTDDTQMTLFTADALLRCEQDALHTLEEARMVRYGHSAYLRWLVTQNTRMHFDEKTHPHMAHNGWLLNQPLLFKQCSPGITCISSLQSGEAGYISTPINNSKGCGTIMRMAPVGLVLAGRNEDAFRLACWLSAITHGHPSGYLSGGFMASLIADLAYGSDLVTAIDNAITILQKWDMADETMHAICTALELHDKVKTGKSAATPETLQLLGSGWVAEEALAIALFVSLQFKNNFRKGVLFAVNHSGDSDSTGAITGNILGLINGIDKIPHEWITNLQGVELVQQVADDLFSYFQHGYCLATNNWHEKYPNIP